VESEEEAGGEGSVLARKAPDPSAQPLKSCLSAAQKQNNRRSVHSRVGKGVTFTNVAEEEPANPTEAEAFANFKFQVKYPKTVLLANEDGEVVVDYTYISDVPFSLSDGYKITARVKGPDKRVRKYKVALQPTMNSISINFTPWLPGVYKSQVFFCESPLQSKRCRIHVLENLGSNSRQRRAATAGVIGQTTTSGLGRSDDDDDSGDEAEVDNENIVDPETGKKRNYRKSKRFRQGEAMQFVNKARRATEPATGYSGMGLPQDLAKLRPKILLTRVNVTVTYPRQRVNVGDVLLAEVVLEDSLSGRVLKVYDQWKLDCKIDMPNGEALTIKVREDPHTGLNYASFQPSQAGIYRAQIIFNAYPVQHRRCKLKVVKPTGLGRMMNWKQSGRAPKKVEDILSEIMAKRSIHNHSAPSFLTNPHSPAKAGTGRPVKNTKRLDSKAEIEEKKLLMEKELGHTVRVGENLERGEIDRKKLIMEAELGEEVVVTRGRSRTLDKDKKKKKGGREAEIQEKKELMERMLGEEVQVQQVDIGELK